MMVIDGCGPRGDQRAGYPDPVSLNHRWPAIVDLRPDRSLDVRLFPRAATVAGNRGVDLGASPAARAPMRGRKPEPQPAIIR
jgi:hypothetical protein